MDYTTAQPSEPNLDNENFLTKEGLIRQLELSGVNLGNDPSARIDTYVAAGLLPIPQLGHFPTWTVQRIIAIENKLAAGQSLADIQKEVHEERRRFLSGAKDLNSLVSLYKKFQKNSAFFLFSFLLLFVLGMSVVASSIVAPGNPVAVASEHMVKVVAEGAGKVAKVAAAPVGKTLVVFIQASKPEDSKSADPLQLTNIEAAKPVIPENLVQLDSLGNIDISGQMTAASFSGSGENLTSLPATEVIGELNQATFPWSSVTSQPIILSSLNSISNDEGNIDLAAGTGLSILSDTTLKKITLANTDTGSSQAIFKNIAVTGQSTVVADSNNDTLTLVAGANLVITTDATGDSVTFSVTGTVANADTLDLLDSSQFLRSDTSDSFTSGTLTFEASTTLSVLGTFTCTDCVGDTAVANNITASNYLPLAGGTMGGNIDLNTNLLLNIGGAGTDFTAGGGLTLAGLETLSSLSISSGSRVSNTITFNPAAGGSQYGYSLTVTNAPTVAANTAYGIYVSQADTVDLANTNYGVYSSVTHTGPTSGTIDTYGGYFSATGDAGGTSRAYGVYGTASGADTTWGVIGYGGSGGLYGSGNTYGVFGLSVSGTAGVFGAGDNAGVYGFGTTYGVYGEGNYGLYGSGANTGVYGSGSTGLYGNGGTYGVYGTGSTGLYGSGSTYGVYGYVNGAMVTAGYSGYLSNTATSSTAGINKYGAYITSTGTWNGAGSNNYALYLADATGGTNNYAIYQAGTTGTNILNANTRIGGVTAPTMALAVTGAISASGGISSGGTFYSTGGVEGGDFSGTVTGVFAIGGTYGVYAETLAGTALYADLLGAGTAIVSFRDNGTEVFKIADGGSITAIGTFTAGGSITAGTSTTTHTLTGMLCIRNATACPAQAAGRLYVDTTGTVGGDDPGDVFDIAEYFPAIEAVEKGELVSVSPQGRKLVQKSTGEYDPSLLGIVSTNPAAVIEESWISLGAGGSGDFNPLKPYVALAGRVPTKVSTENGSIEPGDPLTSSSTPGVAMKATKSGPIVGKALEAFACSQPTSQSTDRSQQTTAVDSSPNAVDQLSDSSQSTVDSCYGRIMVFVSVGWFVQPISGNGDQGSGISSFTNIDTETLTAGTVNAQVLFVGERKISMAKDGSLKIEGNVEITGSLIAGKISTDELVVSEKSSGSAAVKAGTKEMTIENDLVKDTSKILVTFTTDYSPATRYYVTKEVGKSFTLHLDQPVGQAAAFDWLIIN